MRLLNVVVNYKTPKMLHRFADSYQEFVKTEDSRLVVVDVESDYTDDSYSGVDADIFLWSQDNIGFARSVNLGVQTGLGILDADIIGIFNADTAFLNSECITTTLKCFSEDNVGVVGPRQVDSKNRVTHAGFYNKNGTIVGPGWHERNVGQYISVMDAHYVSGSAMFVRRTVWDELSSCESFLDASPEADGAMLVTPHYYEDRFLCEHALAHGHRVIYNGSGTMLHEWHASSPVGSWVDQEHKESRKIFSNACRVHGFSILRSAEA